MHLFAVQKHVAIQLFILTGYRLVLTLIPKSQVCWFSVWDFPLPTGCPGNCQHYARDLVHFLSQDGASFAQLLCRDREVVLSAVQCEGHRLCYAHVTLLNQHMDAT